MTDFRGVDGFGISADLCLPTNWVKQPGYCGRFDWEIFSDSAGGGIRTRPQLLFIDCGGGRVQEA